MSVAIRTFRVDPAASVITEHIPITGLEGYLFVLSVMSLVVFGLICFVCRRGWCKQPAT